MYQESKERDRVLTRRLFLVMAGMTAAGPVPAQAKFGDEEWMRRFKEFVKTFNDFVVALNDGRLDRGKWERMRTEWQRLEVA
jgi:hypothetical protein